MGEGALMAPLPVRAGVTAVLLGLLGHCAAAAGAEPPPEVVVIVVPPGMEAAQDVIWCESRGRWDVVSEDGEYWGAWQLHRASHEAKALRRGWTWEEMHADPAKQTALAVEIWTASGWAPWSGCAP